MVISATRTKVLTVAPGSLVVVRDAEWRVLAAEPSQDGLKIRVQGVSELVRDTTATFYEALDTIEPLDPADAKVVPDGSSGYRQAKLWLEATLRKTPAPLSDKSLTVSTKMLTNPLGYQRSAVERALDPKSLRPRILIADAVGLGKTIEIGMILAELARRGRGERILVVTPKHVLEQMQHELWTRFALPFVRLDSVGIQRVRQKLPATRNPFSLYKRAIISLDTLKQDKYRAHLARHHWDAVVIDESHNVTGGSTLNNALAKLIAPNTDALILASATPHNGKRESFAELIRLLEPTAVSPDGIIDPEELQRLVVRRHRHSEEVAREVGSDWAERKPLQHLSADATEEENAVIDELVDSWLRPVDGHSPYSGQTSALFPWTLAKSFLSSPAAFMETVRTRMRTVRAGEDSQATRGELVALQRLDDLASHVGHATSAKFATLVEHLRSLSIGPRSDERVVVFSERVATLGWLRDGVLNALKLRAEQVQVLHGQLSDTEQQEIVEDFKRSSSKVRVLITGDVASEGVNLHSQCHELVHYDIPWSLIRIEQRNGRIDRYGQRHSPQITTMLLRPENERFSGDIHVLERLVEREDEAHRALGDASVLMGEYDVRGEEKAIARALERGTAFEEVVPAPAQALDDTTDPWEALLASPENDPFADLLTTSESEEMLAAPVVPRRGTGLFENDAAMLEAAVRELYPAAENPPARGGVGWTEHNKHGLVQLVPPKDLQQRLATLPQSYLRDRKVTDKLTLAIRQQVAEKSLDDARNDPASDSLWPESHYLGPQHPVIEWACDRVLARSERNEVFVVRGAVEEPTVLLIGTLTNKRGQIVASHYVTVEFPIGIAQVHESAGDAIASLGIAGSNTGAVDDLDEVQDMIRRSVEKARASVSVQAVATRAFVDANVEAWAGRVNRWEQEADALIQREQLRARRITVDEEGVLAEQMRPDQDLIRPLLVVMPQEGQN